VSSRRAFVLKLNVAAFAILTVWGPAARANFISLNYPGAYDTVAEGINNNGQIVGYQTGPMNNIFEGFLFDGVAYTPIDVPGGFHTIAQGIKPWASSSAMTIARRAVRDSWITAVSLQRSVIPEPLRP
jgi:hypothetical protein